MIIYTDTDFCDDWSDVTVIKNINIYTNSPGPKSAVFHAPFPRHLDFDHLEETFNQIYDVSEKIVLLVSELHDVTTDFIEKFDRPRIVFFLNGDLNFKLTYATTYYWHNWVETTTTFYKNNLTLLDQLDPYTVKPKYFDILLGQKRPHRDEIFAYIKDHNLADQVVMTYINDGMQSFQNKQTDEWIWESAGLEIPNWPIRHTVRPVKYHDQIISLSQIIPISIYNETAYSLVAETWGIDNRFTFNTEKIVKPILAERLFLVASNQYYLRNLRALGFKTFDGIIDESYDLEPDYKLRCQMVGQQISFLSQQPQDVILSKIKEITHHNKQLMLDTDWYNDFLNCLHATII